MCVCIKNIYFFFLVSLFKLLMTDRKYFFPPYSNTKHVQNLIKYNQFKALPSLENIIKNLSSIVL